MTIPLDSVTGDLEHHDPAFRRRAAEALARLGTEAVPAAVPLVKACGDPDAEVREWAAAALEDLGPPEAADVVPLGRLLESPNPGIGYWAATLLGRCRAEAEPAIEPLGAALAGSAFPEVRQRAAWALGKIGPAARSVLPLLEKAAHSEDPRLARLVAQSMETIRTP